jgi:glycosyltransferase involved in cell wall biosynthesis
MELVSVIIPTYNRIENLYESINSVLNQTYKNIEIIIINDCSTDKKYETLDKTYKDHANIYIIHLQINMRHKYNINAAQGYTKNEGMKIAKGKWIAFLDDDDYWVNPNKLSIQIYFMHKYKCFLCSSNMFIGHGQYTKNKNILDTYFSSLFLFGTKIEESAYIFDKKCIEKSNYINNSSCIIHKSIMKKTGLFVGGINEDYNYWLRALEYTRGIYIQKPLVYYDNGIEKGKFYS